MYPTLAATLHAPAPFMEAQPEKKNHDPEPMRIALVVLMVGIVVGSALAASESSTVHVTTAQGDKLDVVASSVMNDQQVFLFCLTGAALGALVSFCFFPSKTGGEAARKTVGSLACGAGMTPMLLHWRGVTLDLFNVIGYSLIVALLSYAVLQGLMPFATDGVISFFKRLFGWNPPTPPASP